MGGNSVSIGQLILTLVECALVLLVLGVFMF